MHQGRDPVDELDQVVVGGAGGQPVGVAEDHRDADAAFVDPALAAAQAGVEALVERVLAGLEHVGRVEEGGAVVAGEEHDGLLGEAIGVELVEQPADALVHPLDHGIGGGDDAVQALLQMSVGHAVGRLEGRVRRAVGEVQEEGRTLVAVDEGHGFLGQDVGHVAAVGAADAVIDPQRVVEVVDPTAAKADEFVEAAGVGLEPAVERAVVPFANQASGVARVLKRSASVTSRRAMRSRPWISCWVMAPVRWL